MKNQSNNQSTTFILTFVAFIFLNLPSVLAQSPSSSNELLIRFEPSASPADIDDWRDSVSAVELAVTPLSQVRLWQINQFPTNNGLIDINEIIAGSKAKAKVNSAGANYKDLSPWDNSGLPLLTWDPTALCEGFSTICATENNPVKIAILDAGVGYAGVNSDPIFCLPSLFDPYYGSYIGHDFVNNDLEPKDDNGHGTHIAGIIAEIAELANLVEPNPIELASYKTHDMNGEGEIFDIIQAIDKAVLNGANIINLSCSYQAPPPSGKPEPLEMAINIAGDYGGTLVVAAAGNDSHDNDSTLYPSYPASFNCPNILSVASVDCDKNLSSSSNWGATNVDIAMLGENIVGPNLSGEMVTKDGTSQATAIVSGIAALLATNLTTIHYEPLKCSILNSAQSQQFLQNLILTEGIAHAEKALTELINNCGISYRSNEIGEPQPTMSIESFTAYPNPFSDHINLTVVVETAGKINFSVTNAFGQTVYTEQRNATMPGKLSFFWQPRAEAPSGMYLLQVVLPGKTIVKKIIRE